MTLHAFLTALVLTSLHILHTAVLGDLEFVHEHSQSQRLLYLLSIPHNVHVLLVQVSDLRCLTRHQLEKLFVRCDFNNCLYFFELILHFLHFPQKLTSSHSIYFNFLPLLRIEISDHCSELLLLRFQCLDQRLVRNVQFVELFAAHVAQFPVEHLELALVGFGLRDHLAVLELHVLEIRFDLVHVQTVLSDHVTHTRVLDHALRTQECHIALAKEFHSLIRVSDTKGGFVLTVLGLIRRALWLFLANAFG